MLERHVETNKKNTPEEIPKTQKKITFLLEKRLISKFSSVFTTSLINFYVDWIKASVFGSDQVLLTFGAVNRWKSAQELLSSVH